ncbi:MAG: hypothetical protein LBS11_11070 [Oscillospiraceae bacterium]|jgi:hypothetical protein|nr:hypothetical protein [Oscillospiraceae bacterium]
MTIAQSVCATTKTGIRPSLTVRIVSPLLFVVLFFLALSYITDKLIPVDTHWFIARENIQRMNRLPKNTIDIAVLGGSTSYHSFSPYELYVKYGISSRCLGTSNQPMSASYYTLLELLKTQSPRMVILEAEKLTGSSSEADFRRVVDLMPISCNKLHVILAHTQMEGSDSLLSYIFPLTKFNSTWKELTYKSFINVPFRVNPASNETMYAGFVMVSGQHGKDYSPIAKLGDESADYNEESLDYLKQIVELCRERGIQFLLYSSLRATWTEQRHNATQAFADENNIRYIDFNVKEAFMAADLSYPIDLWDTAHTNTFGAIKTTRFLGEVITSACSFLDRRNDPDYAYFAAELPDYEHWVHVERIQSEKNLASYLLAVTEGADALDYSVYISVKDEASRNISQEVGEAFNKIGVTTDFADKYHYSYLCVIGGGKVIYEKLASDASEALSHTGVNPDGSAYAIESAGYECGNRSIIKVGNVDASRNARGFNIVVYDNRARRVVDSVTWDTYLPDATEQAQHKAMTP